MPDSDSEEKIWTNGIHARTGEYLLAPSTPANFTRGIARSPPDSDLDGAARSRFDDAANELMKTIAGVDDTDIAEAGWAVVFSGIPEHEARAAEIRGQLQPLLDHRKAGAGDLYREYSGRDGWRNESGRTWLARHGVGPGSADPKQMPFYILIAGGPEEVPFEFQYRVDLQRAVGRVSFDEVEDYGRYARGVVAAESSGQRARKRLELFGPRNRGDRATSLSRSLLIEPLHRKLSGEVGWEVEATVDAKATKDRLSEIVNGSAAPALMMTASHGVGFDADDPDQRGRQGAPICADWPGVGKPVLADHCFAAGDVASDAPLAGRIALLFACYGGATPATDDFAHRVDPKCPRKIADKPFTAALVERLLSGGMLAVVAHVDRAWSYSFKWPRAGEQAQTFESTLRQLMTGAPVGVALDDFNVRTGELAFDQAELLAKVQAGEIDSYTRYAGVWTAATDSRNYVLLGDPATRLAV